MDKQTTIRKSKPKTRFMTLPNVTAQNTKLSYEALGMLTYIQSLPEDWVLHVNTLAREGCGRDKAYRIIAELIEKGYAKRERILNEKKQVTRVEYEVSDFPDFLEAKPLPENPDMVLPDMENQELQRKELKKETRNQEIQAMVEVVKKELKQYNKPENIAKALLGSFTGKQLEKNIDGAPFTPEQVIAFGQWWDANHKDKDGIPLTRPKNMGSVKTWFITWQEKIAYKSAPVMPTTEKILSPTEITERAIAEIMKGM